MDRILTSIAAKKERLNQLRPLPQNALARLGHYYDIELTYTSNAIELVQMDGSFENWLEDRGPRGCLLHMVDDATSTGWATFAEEETTWGVADTLRAWVEKYGVPRALYVDWKNVYHHQPTVNTGSGAQSWLRIKSMAVMIPVQLASNCSKTAARRAWLDRLPDRLRTLERRWSLSLRLPFEDATCSWAAPAALADGTSAVLKLGMPHMEAEHEIDGLRFWNGDPTVRLLDADDELGAMLLERCEPGTPLRALPDPEQDVVIAELLRRLWRVPPAPHPFRTLSTMVDEWSRETVADRADWPDSGLVVEGLRVFQELSRESAGQVLLATDLHAGNVLRSERNTWLVIDPKPFIGDPAFDATQHLFNQRARMRSDPHGTIGRFADLLGVDRDRVRLWTFARAAAEPRTNWRNSETIALARAIAS